MPQALDFPVRAEPGGVPNEPRNLATLPFEILVMIFERVLESPEPIILKPRTRQPPILGQQRSILVRGNVPDVQVLAPSRAIYTAATDVLYKKNTFIIKSSETQMVLDGAAAWIDCIGTRRDMVTNLHGEVDERDYIRDEDNTNLLPFLRIIWSGQKSASKFQLTGIENPSNSKTRWLNGVNRALQYLGDRRHPDWEVYSRLHSILRSVCMGTNQNIRFCLDYIPSNDSQPEYLRYLITPSGAVSRAPQIHLSKSISDLFLHDSIRHGILRHLHVEQDFQVDLFNHSALGPLFQLTGANKEFKYWCVKYMKDCPIHFIMRLEGSHSIWSQCSRLNDWATAAEKRTGRRQPSNRPVFLVLDFKFEESEMESVALFDVNSLLNGLYEAVDGLKLMKVTIRIYRQGRLTRTHDLPLRILATWLAWATNAIIGVIGEASLDLGPIPLQIVIDERGKPQEATVFLSCNAKNPAGQKVHVPLKHRFDKLELEDNGALEDMSFYDKLSAYEKKYCIAPYNTKRKDWSTLLGCIHTLVKMQSQFGQ